MHSIVRSNKSKQLKHSLIVVTMVAILSGGCAIDPPAKPGVWLYDGGEKIQLNRFAHRLVSSELLPVSILEKTPRVAGVSNFVVKLADAKSIAGVEAFWQIEDENGKKVKQDAKLVVLERDPNAFRLVFERLPEVGYALLRVKGSKVSGWYPMVLKDDFSWAFREGRSWAKAEKWEKAVVAFKRAVDYDDKPEALRQLGVAHLMLKQYKETLDVAENAWKAAQNASMNLVLAGSLLGEALMMEGRYKDGLEIFDKLQNQYPADKRHSRVLGKLLAGVDPSPDALVKQIYTAAAREGADGVEAYVNEEDLENKGEGALKAFTRKLLKFGRVKLISIRKVQRFGKVAFVSYQVRYSDGTKLDRKMTFQLDDKGHYKVQLD